MKTSFIFFYSEIYLFIFKKFLIYDELSVNKFFLYFFINGRHLCKIKLNAARDAS